VCRKENSVRKYNFEKIIVMLFYLAEIMKVITEKRKTGNLGEDLACRFLMKHGFDIIDRNYLKKCGEIDIVAINASKLHFIEVKSVSLVGQACETLPSVSGETKNIDGFRPEDNVHPWKLQRLARTIQVYLTEKNISDETDWQFDVITVYIDKKRLVSKVILIENVVL
jgi:putative endonuclease